MMKLKLQRKISLFIANLFNKFFIDSVTDIQASIETSNNALDVNSLKYCRNVLKFKSLTLEQLFETIKRLKNKKDFDGINIQFVLDAWSHIGQTLLEIINESLSKGIFFKLLEEFHGSSCSKNCRSPKA